MQIRVRYEWDRAKASANLQKHGVSFDNARYVFLDPHIMTKHDRDNSIDEVRWISVGLNANGIPVLVVHTYNDQDAEMHVVRLISARAPSKREAEAYWKGRFL